MDYLGESSRRRTNDLDAGEEKQPPSQARHGKDLSFRDVRPEALQTLQQPFQAFGSQMASSCARPIKRPWRGFEADGEMEPKARRIRESNMVEELEHPETALLPSAETVSSEPSNLLQLVPAPSVSYHVALPEVVPRLPGHLWREAMVRAPSYHSMALVPWSPSPVVCLCAWQEDLRNAYYSAVQIMRISLWSHCVSHSIFRFQPWSKSNRAEQQRTRRHRRKIEC